MAVFSTGERKRRPRGDRKSMEMSQHLKQTFEATIKVGLFPRSQIDIFVEVLQVADTPLVDVSSLEATTGGPELTVAAHPKSGQIVLLEMSHRFHLDHLDKVMEVALAGCRDIHTILDAAVRS